MTTERDRIQARITAEAQQVVKTTRIDLDGFLALSSDERGARWRQWDEAAKFQAVAMMLERRCGDWTVEAVAHWTAHYNAKWEASQVVTDMTIPPASEILGLAKERSETAQRHEDWAGAAQLNRLRVNVQRGARLSWHLGDLLIQSVNHPGTVYSVSRKRCTCPNGQAGKASCWHICLHDLLLDMLDTAADTADMEADAAAERAAAAQLGRRLCAARAQLYSEAA